MHFEITELLKKTPEAQNFEKIFQNKTIEDMPGYYEKICIGLEKLYASYLKVIEPPSSIDEQKNYLNILTNAQDNFEEFERVLEFYGELTVKETQAKVKKILNTIREVIKNLSPEEVSIPSIPVDNDTVYDKLVFEFLEYLKIGSPRNTELQLDFAAANFIDSYSGVQKEINGLGGKKTFLNPESKQVMVLYKIALNKKYPATAFRIIETCIEWHLHIDKRSAAVEFLPRILQKFLPVTGDSKKNLREISIDVQAIRKESNLFIRNLQILATTAGVKDLDIATLVKSPSAPAPALTRKRAGTSADKFGKLPEGKLERRSSTSSIPQFNLSSLWKNIWNGLESPKARLHTFSEKLDKISLDAKNNFSGYSLKQLELAFKELTEINNVCIDKIEKYKKSTNLKFFPSDEYDSTISQFKKMLETAGVLITAVDRKIQQLSPQPLIPPLTSSTSSTLI